MPKAKRPIFRKKRFYVYILECRDGTFYTGYTNDLEKRVKDHNEGKRGAKYTRSRLPVKLVWKKEHKELKLSLKTERIIKGLTRKQKELLVSGCDIGVYVEDSRKR